MVCPLTMGKTACFFPGDEEVLVFGVVLADGVPNGETVILEPCCKMLVASIIFVMSLEAETTLLMQDALSF